MKTRITEIFAIKHPIIQGGIQSRSNLPNFLCDLIPMLLQGGATGLLQKKKVFFV